MSMEPTDSCQNQQWSHKQETRMFLNYFYCYQVKKNPGSDQTMILISIELEFWDKKLMEK